MVKIALYFKKIKNGGLWCICIDDNLYICHNIAIEFRKVDKDITWDHHETFHKKYLPMNSAWKNGNSNQQYISEEKN